MSALRLAIDSAVGNVIAKHPRLFDAKQRERAHKILSSEIVRELVREPKSDAEAEAVAPNAAGGLVPVNDPRAIAYCRLREMAGAVAPNISSIGIFVGPEADTAAVRALAEAPPRDRWAFVTDKRQLGSWLDFFDAALPGVARRRIFEKRESDGAQGLYLPWPWPPSKEGKVYAAASETEDETEPAE